MCSINQSNNQTEVCATACWDTESDFMIILFILFLRVGTNEGIELIGRQQDDGHGHHQKLA